MSKYLGLVKLTTQEATRTVQEGPRTRKHFVDVIVQQSGGTVEGFWFTNAGDWDVVCLLDMGNEPEGVGAVAALERRAAGLTEHERWIELTDVEAVAAALDNERRRLDRP